VNDVTGLALCAIGVIAVVVMFWIASKSIGGRW
jgi:hypothetical protein